jgi:hypothetical protein
MNWLSAVPMINADICSFVQRMGLASVVDRNTLWWILLYWTVAWNKISEGIGVIWFVTPFGLLVDTDVSVKRTVSIFRVEVMSDTNRPIIKKFGHFSYHLWSNFSDINWPIRFISSMDKELLGLSSFLGRVRSPVIKKIQRYGNCICFHLQVSGRGTCYFGSTRKSCLNHWRTKSKQLASSFVHERYMQQKLWKIHEDDFYCVSSCYLSLTRPEAVIYI